MISSNGQDWILKHKHPLIDHAKTAWPSFIGGCATNTLSMRSVAEPFMRGSQHGRSAKIRGILYLEMYLEMYLEILQEPLDRYRDAFSISAATSVLFPPS